MTQVALQLALRARDQPMADAFREERIDLEAELKNAPADALRGFISALRNLLERSGTELPPVLQRIMPPKPAGHVVIDVEPAEAKRLGVGALSEFCAEADRRLQEYRDDLRRDADECLRKMKEIDMGAASDIVGKHDIAPAGVAPTTILGFLTSAVDALDKALQEKEKDLKKEKGEEVANGLKIGQLRAADGLVRQARAIMEDYGDAGLKAKEKKDPFAWIKVGVHVLDEDGHEWEIKGAYPKTKTADLQRVDKAYLSANGVSFEELSKTFTEVDSAKKK